jgi:hypothetical protein
MHFFSSRDVDSSIDLFYFVDNLVWIPLSECKELISALEVFIEPENSIRHVVKINVRELCLDLTFGENRMEQYVG